MADNNLGERFCQALCSIGWSTRKVAEIIQVDESNLRKIESGRRRVSDDLVTWIEKLAAFHTANPPPLKSKR